MSDPFLIGWDLGTARNGWCAGSGEKLPAVGAFRLTKIEDAQPICQIGDMGAEFTSAVLHVHERFPQATHWVAERPLLITQPSAGRPYADKRFNLERLYGLSCLLQTLGRKLGKVCAMVEPGQAKLEFAGRGATKDQMVAIAERLGIPLPKFDTDGREDIADACGVWKVGVRLFARRYLHLWDGAIYRRRGELL